MGSAGRPREVRHAPQDRRDGSGGETVRQGRRLGAHSGMSIGGRSHKGRRQYAVLDEGGASAQGPHKLPEQALRLAGGDRRAYTQVDGRVCRRNVPLVRRYLWMEKFGIRLFEGYGSTECSPLLTINSRIFCNFNSIGKIVPGIEYKLRKIEGVKEGGSLVVKGPNVMLGAMLASNPGVIVSPPAGWYDTGDVMAFDDMGFAYLKGRLKRFAKIGGEMVSLPSLENLVKRAYPNKDFECNAVAIPHDTKGEQIILVTTSKDITLETLIPSSNSRALHSFIFHVNWSIVKNYRF